MKKLNALLSLVFLVLLLAAFSTNEASAQTSSRTSTSQKKTKKSSSESEPWSDVTLLLDRPEKPYEVIGLVSAPQIFLWDDEESMKESLQKQAWKMKADAVILDRVDTSFRFTGPAGGANGRAIRYK
jgi:maltose-binding protein MalE